MTESPAVQVERWDVFARGPGGGNPCYLVRADAGSAVGPAVGPAVGRTVGPAVGPAVGQTVGTVVGPEVGQAVARRYGGEAALVTATGAGLDLRFFSPGGEMAMCVHASIAAVSALVAAGELDGHQVSARTASGDCAISWDDARPPLVSVELPAPRLGPPLDLAAEVTAALGLPVELVDGGQFGIRVVGGARPKLLVPLADAGAVHAARPQPEQLGAVCRGVEATGCYVFARHPDGQGGHLIARQFPVDAGIAEDAATGVAASALAAYLAAGAGPAGPTESVVQIDQGDAMGRPSRLTARAFGVGGLVRRTQVAGRARFILRETVRL